MEIKLFPDPVIQSAKVSVQIRGDGIAARCCELLLQRAGIATNADRGLRLPVPAILLADSALALIRDVFEDDRLFRNAPQIRHRVVKWRPETPPVVLPHSGIVVSELELLENLAAESVRDEEATLQSTVYASRPLPVEVTHHAFGTRMAAGVPISLRGDAPSETCWIESLREGWLFLLPGWLLAVGASPEELLRESKLIAGLIEALNHAGGMFAAYPRIASPLCGAGWIACGSAAMAFDPLCGDGTAHAVREGILAAAVLRAEGDANGLAHHYNARLTAGFQRHLLLCRQFYQTGYGGPWWDQELELVEQGLAWCASKLNAHGAFQYRLNGYDLEPLVT